MSGHALLEGIEATRWQVLPSDMDEWPFSDGARAFGISIVLKVYKGERCFIVSQDEATGWTKNGKQVWLRHDVNAKHARHVTFDEAQQLAHAIVNGHIHAEGYTHWRTRAAAIRPPEAAS